ncbi:MAG: CoA transferase [Deltaproteobacteria bacterium]|nr:CoA transferase [Deltaproteobacteria bacterium]MBW2415864.1 CoA transferase [Deltaproteobacteria bacterium]
MADSKTPRNGPFDGIRVLDLTQIIAGPFGCMMLADLGAEVIKVEPPGGEPWRQVAPFMPGESKSFQSLNRGKRSLAIRLDDPRGQAIVHRLIPTIDVVVTNFRPDVPARLRVDYETLSAIRPDLIYVDNTAFGREGPWADLPGYDIVAQAVTGLMAGEGKVNDRGHPLYIVSSPVADYSTGLAIAWAASAALFHRERTGEGQRVESSLLATALALQGGVVMENPKADDAFRTPARERRRALQQEGAPYAEQARARSAPGRGGMFYRAYRTRDGAIAIGALSPPLREKARRALESDFLGQEDPDYDPHDPEFLAKARRAAREVEERMQTRTTAEWLQVLGREGVPAGPVQFPEEMSEDPQVRANGLMVDLVHDVSGPQTTVGPILKFSTAGAPEPRSSPPLGRDTDTCLRELGYPADEIDDLRAAGIVG